MSIMDQNNVFMRSENRSVRPGSEGWWAQKEGAFLFSRKRTVDNKKMGKAILTAAAMGAALIGAFWWLAVTFLP